MEVPAPNVRATGAPEAATGGDAGRVVVEVDGYGWHSSPTAFAADRARDYELTLTGYLVLRLPHDFVVSDPALAAERVRDPVRFRRRRPPPPAGAFDV